MAVLHIAVNIARHIPDKGRTAVRCVREVQFRRAAQCRQAVVQVIVTRLQIRPGYIVIQQILPQEVPVIVPDMVQPLFPGVEIPVT